MKNFPLVKAAGLILLALTVFGCRSLQVQAPPDQPFTFVQACDPQIGMGGYEDDLKRFEQEVKQINELHPDFVVICGDLVNRTDKASFADFNRIKSKLTVPCYCAPGNHDVGNTVTPRLLEQYRQCVGRDYYAFEHKDCTFVVANTQLWVAPLPGESEKHDAWFTQTLQAAAKKHQRIFVVAHFPLFAKEPNEPDSYYNIPMAKRTELMALFKECGVVAMLVGHTHTTFMRELDGMQLVASQNTCKNFDKQPFGFRLWHVGPSRPYQHEFVPLLGQP